MNWTNQLVEAILDVESGWWVAILGGLAIIASIFLAIFIDVGFVMLIAPLVILTQGIAVSLFKGDDW